MEIEFKERDPIILVEEDAYEVPKSTNGGDDEHSVMGLEIDGKAERKSNGNLSRKAGTFSSATTSEDSTSAAGSGKQIADTLQRKVMYMLPTVVALIFHIIYIVLLFQLNSKEGMVLPFNYHDFGHSGPIIFEVIGIVCHLTMDAALNDALSAYAGWLLTRKEGYSIVVCGFVHADVGPKVTFPNRLSYRSTAKPFLTKMSLIYLFHLVAVLLTFIAATGVGAHQTRVDYNQLMCVVYSQSGTRPMDRGIPTVAHEMGVAELIDTTATGYLRIEDPTMAASIHLLPPQLTDVCQDGSTIKGDGILTYISTTCSCSSSSGATDLANTGLVSSSVASSIASKAADLVHVSGWINYLNYDESSKTINITTALTGTKACGGINYTSPSLPICVSTLSNHSFAKIMVQYKTDGSPASIAAKTATLLEVGDSANMTWLYTALQYSLGGLISSEKIPSHWPGATNPLLWMASENMQDIALGKLEPGLEAAMALLVRVSIQRSYTTAGSTCVQNIIDPSTVTLNLDPYGFYIGLVWIIGQFLVNAIAIIGFFPWFGLSTPIFPAIEACNNPIIFSLLSAKNDATLGRMKGMSSNMEDALLWPRLDMVLRVGESIQTADDPDRGIILLGKPKMVTDMTYQKTYV